MGQGQSTDNANEVQEETLAKADYYDLLGVERTATDEEIKKAYRRKALELHPDRNYGNVEDATRLFAEVQSAYEVLSDPQERAWYDSHRDILLRGDQATGPSADEFSYNIRMTTAEEVLKLMIKFNGRMEYSNAPSGFYGGLNDFFKQLAKEEDIACQWEDQDSMDYPEFGLDTDDYDDVVRPFYAYWNGFATRKSYAWKDQYRLSDAPDRRIRRLMEKENKKIREEAIQQYNEAVRSLVAFVRKRDPRVQNNQKSEAERQKALRDATAAQAARSRAARQAKLQEDAAAVPDWAKSRTRDEHEGGFSSESDIEEHEYDCVVCDKTFKSDAQYKAHEKSKKHVKLLKQLQKEMRDEGAKLDLRGAGQATPHREDITDEEASGENVPEQHQPMEVGDQDEDEAEEQEDAHAPKERPSANGTTGKTDTSRPDSDETDDDYASRSDVEQRLAGGPLAGLSSKIEDISLEGTPLASESDGPAQPKMGKAKQKKAKKAAQKAADQSAFQCAVCKAEFPSKTRLFNHIKDEDHAAPVSQTKSVKGGKGKKR
ncbi:DnaJ protein, subfamily A, member 5 [Exophiala viscosa]|uniref:DnaJ protein, subfamily A, member 5 n=1 Tax=Exophiala viscosa TaxID=2486360 RepID=A0AAN6ICJ1_9EURO|nr:DnaJ protein, subfamily A, member 5 [Exophiala viscosa]